MTDDAVEHGTTAGYSGKARCRCDACRAAWAAWAKARTDERHALMLAGELTPEHGTPSTYVNFRCRCKPCRRAWAEAARQRAERRRVAQGFPADRGRGRPPKAKGSGS